MIERSVKYFSETSLVTLICFNDLSCRKNVLDCRFFISALICSFVYTRKLSYMYYYITSDSPWLRTGRAYMPTIASACIQYELKYELTSATIIVTFQQIYTKHNIIHLNHESLVSLVKTAWKSVEFIRTDLA